MYHALSLLALCVVHVTAHGVVTKITGANGVTMPGLSVVDGTPRDCASPLCGAEDDTSIIRDDELGTDEASALGRTSNGPVDASSIVSTFMGGNSSSAKKRGLLDDFLGGGDDSDSSATESDGTETAEGTTENLVGQTAGKGAASGLPTCSDDGSITMTFHQVNQDGAGPLQAAVDPSSGGTDASAFQDAQLTQDVPGTILGLSGTQTTDFPIAVQMPEGMTCDGEISGVKNVCVVRVRNSALAGPFGGSAAFTQSAGAKKRAIAFRMTKRRARRSALADVA